MKIQAVISNKELSFTDTEKKIATYIMEHGASIAQQNSTQLAALIGTSQSSVIKFVNKLGYEKYADFKLQIYEDFVRKEQMNSLSSQNVSLNDPLRKVIQAIYGETMTSLQQTYENLEHQPIEACIAWLEQAKRIFICGKGASFLAAQDLASKLLKFGFAAICLQDLDTMETSAGCATSDDVYICFSYSGETEALKRIFIKAKQHHAKLVTVTKNTHSTLGEMSDLCLAIITNEPRYRVASMSSRIAFFSIVDVLYLGILKNNLQERLMMISSIPEERSL